MRGTRIILQRAVSQQQAHASKNHHKIIIPSRTTWELYKSAANGVYSLLSSQQNRDDFVDNYMDKIINPDVLHQAHHGGMLMLALYNDLNSPLFKEENKSFNVLEFTDGVRYALQRFHDVHGQLENTMYAPTGENKDENEPVRSSDDNNIKIPSPPQESNKQSTDDSNDDMDITKMIEDLEKNSKDVLAKTNWSEKAKNNPDSLAGQLRNMTSDEFFDFVETSTVHKHLFLQHTDDNHDNNDEKQKDGDIYLYEEGSSEVNHVALLSARAMAMETKNDDDDCDDDDDDDDDRTTDSIRDNELNLKDKNKTTATSSEVVPVAAQLEVLYDLKQTYVPMPKLVAEGTGSTATASSDANKEKNIGGSSEENDNKEASKSTQKEPMTKTHVAVAIFEGWLKNPDGKTNDIRWKLVGSRHAWEFPALAAMNSDNF